MNIPLALLVLSGLCLPLAAASDPPAPAAAPPPPAALEESSLRQLLAVRRVYVDRMTGGETAAQIREILISAMQGTQLFIVTENPDRADAVLRGAAEDLVFTDAYSSSEGINIHATTSTRSDSYASGVSHNATSTRDSRGLSAGVGAGDNESMHSSERRHEAVAAVRLVNKEGDVIWATTQESLGGRFRGASTDVADKITARLKEDFERARKLK